MKNISIFFILCFLILHKTQLYSQRNLLYIDKTLNTQVNIQRDKEYIIASVCTDPNVRIKIENDREYYWFKSSQIYNTYGGYYGKLLDGIYKVYDRETRKLLLVGYYKYGLKDSIWKSWYSDGKLKEVIEYKQGVYNGKYIAYSSDGVLLEEIHYKNGLKSGHHKTFLKDTVIVHKYNNGKLVTKSKKKSKKKIVSNTPVSVDTTGQVNKTHLDPLPENTKLKTGKSVSDTLTIPHPDKRNSIWRKQ